MRIEVNRNELLQALNKCLPVIGKGSVLPILENFYFHPDTDNEKLNIVGSNLNTTVSTSVEAKVSDGFSVCIPANIFTDAIKNLKDTVITIEVNQNNLSVTIKSGKGKYKMAAENGSEFPDIAFEGVSGSANIEIDTDIFKNAIGSVLPSCGYDALRPNMTGVYFEPSKQGLNLVATDAHQLTKVTIPNEVAYSTDLLKPVIVPKTGLDIVLKTFKTNALSIFVSDRKVIFSDSETYVSTTLIDATYPNYQSVIPVNNPFKLTVNRKNLLEALKRVNLFSNRKSNAVTFNLCDGLFSLSSQDLDFSNEAFEEFEAEYNGDILMISFNAIFLQNMLSVLVSDKVVFELESSKRAGILYPKEKEETMQFCGVVMPVML